MQWPWNSTIDASSLSYNAEAIHLTDASNCVISRCALFENVEGFILDCSDSCLLWDNSIVESIIGITLQDTSNCLIRLNDISFCMIGIRLDSSSDSNWIFSNHFENNEMHAICLGTSNHWDDGVSIGNLWDDYSGTPPYIIDEDDVDNYPIPHGGPTNTTTTTTTNGFTIDRILIYSMAGAAIALIAAFIILTERRTEPS